LISVHGYPSASRAVDTATIIWPRNKCVFRRLVISVIIYVVLERGDLVSDLQLDVVLVRVSRKASA
jgi:hypothetical protein